MAPGRRAANCFCAGTYAITVMQQTPPLRFRQSIARRCRKERQSIKERVWVPCLCTGEENAAARRARMRTWRNEYVALRCGEAQEIGGAQRTELIADAHE